MAVIRLAVLGSTQVTSAGEPVALRPRERDVLAALAMRYPTPVDTLELAGLIWLVPPSTDLKTLQNHVARVRRVLGTDAIRTVGSAYALGECWQIDLLESLEAVAAGRRAVVAEDHHGAQLRFRQALQRVRGQPFADLEATAGVRLAREEVERVLDDAADSQLRALLRMGDADSALQLATTMPVLHSERRSLLVAIAHSRAGHRVEALQTVHHCRQALRDRGVSPGEALLRVEQALLADDTAVLADDPHESIGVPVSAPAQAAILVGRDPELRRLGTLLAVRHDSAKGCPPVVVVGQSGSGKTALCNRVALEARLGGWTVVDCPRPQRLANVSAAIATAGVGPLLVVVDDADDLSGEDWAALQPGQPHMLVLAACRRAPSVTVTTIVLLPLKRPAVQRLIEATMGLVAGTAPADLVDSVVNGSGSLPAMVIELAVEGATAGGVSGVAGRIVSSLSPAARSLALLLAFATVPVSSGLLLRAAQAVGDGGRASNVAEALAARVIREDDNGALVCRDSAIVTALRLAAAVGWERSARHAWIAVHDEDGDAAAAVADHVAELPDWSFDDALARFDLAAQRANAVADGPTELRNLRRALQLLSTRYGPDHPLVLRREIDLRYVTRVFEHMDSADDAWQLVDRLERLGDHTNLVWLVSRMATVRSALEVEPTSEMVALIDRALALPSDPAVRSMTAADITDVFSLSDVTRCRKYAELSYSLAVGLGDDELQCRAIESLGIAMGHPADWPSLAALCREAVTLAERVDDVKRRGSVLQLVYTCQLQAADPLCRASLDRMAMLAQRFDSTNLDFILAYLEATLLHIEGRLDECEGLVDRLGTLMPLAPSRLEAIEVAQLVGVRVAQGRLGELLEPLDRLVVRQPGFGLWQGARCWATASMGDYSRTRVLLDEIDHGAMLAHTIGWAGAMYGVGRAAALVGEPERCRRVYELLSSCGGWMAWFGNGIYGPLDLALAELQLVIGDHVRAATHLDVADRLVWQLHAPVFLPELAAARARLAYPGPGFRRAT